MNSIFRKHCLMYKNNCHHSTNWKEYNLILFQTFSSARLASLGELQRYAQTGSSLLYYGSPGILNILSPKVIMDLSEINISRFWVVFDKMNAKKSLIEKYSSLDPDGEKTHILEQGYKVSVFLTLLDVSTILTTQWSP